MAITAARLMVEIGGNAEGAVREINNARGAVQNFVRSVSGQSNVVKDIFAGVLGANLAVSAVNTLRGAANEALESYTSYERLGLSLQSLTARELRNTDQTLSMSQALGLAAPKAQELLGWIEQLAIESPFTQTGVSDAFRMAQAYGFTSTEAQRLTQTMIDFAAGSGASEEAMSRVMLALGQIQARGKLSGQEVLQLVNAGLPVTQILAKAFGVTTAQLEEMREKGLIPANLAIEAIVTSLEQDFGGAAKRQTETMGGLRTSLEDLKDIGLREFFTGTFQEIQPYLKEFVGTLQDPEFRANLREMGADFGESIGEIAQGVRDAISWWGDLDDGTKELILTMGGIVLVGPGVVRTLGDIASAGLGLAQAVVGLPTMLQGIGLGFQAWQSGMSLTTALGVAGLSPLAITLGSIALAVGAIVGVWAAWNKNIKETNEQGREAVASTWEDFFDKQVESGKSAVEIQKAYRDAQARANQAVAEGGSVAKLFVDQQGMAKDAAKQLGDTLSVTGGKYRDYIDVVLDQQIAIGRLMPETKAMILQRYDEGRNIDQMVLSYGAYTDGQFAAAAATNVLGDATQTSMSYMQNSAQAADAAKAAMEGLTPALDGANDPMGEAAESAYALAMAEEAAAAEAEANAKALEAAAEAARAATIAYWDLAEGLKGAGQAEIAKGQIDNLQNALKSGLISNEEYGQAVKDIGLAFGLMDNRSIALADNIGNVTGALEAGTLAPDKMSEALKAMIADAADGTVDWQKIMETYGTPPPMEVPGERLPGQISGNMNAGVKDGITQGVTEGFGVIPSEAQKQAELAVTSVKAAFSGQNWTEVGTAISSGIATGIKKGSSLIIKAAEDAAWAAYVAAKEKLGISSPSKMGIEIGYQFMAGQVKGIGQGELALAAAVARSADRMAASAVMPRPTQAAGAQAQSAQAGGYAFNVYGGELHVHGGEGEAVYQGALEQLGGRM